MMQERTGIGASPGIAIGPVYLHSSTLPEVSSRRVEDTEAEIAKLSRSEEKVRERLVGLQQLHGEESEEAEVIGAHLLLLEDPEFTGEIRTLIEDESLCAEAATLRITEESAAMLESLDDEYLAARAADVRDVGTQLLKSILGLPLETWDHLTTPSVLVASDFFPSETATIPPGMALGLCTEEGSATSHIAVFARGMALPAVVGVDLPPLRPGDLMAFDGESGQVYIDPTQEVIDRLRGQHEELRRTREGAAERAHEPAVTRDGTRIEVPPTSERRRTRPGQWRRAPRASGCSAPNSCSSTGPAPSPKRNSTRPTGRCWRLSETTWWWCAPSTWGATSRFPASR